MQNKAFYYVASTTAILLWSASFIATKFAYTTFSPLMVGFLRFLLATALLGIIKLLSKNKERPDKKDMKRIALSGLFGITLYFAAENIGVGLTTASNASLIVASFPAITTLFEFFIYKTKPTVPKLIGITLAFGGVAVLTAKSGFGGMETLWGNLFLIAAGIVWTFYNFLTRSVAEKYSPTTLSFYQFLFGTIFLFRLY